MIDFQDTLRNLVTPICDDKDSVAVKQMESLSENEILLYVYAASNDIGRLIGREGTMANALRQMMQVASKIENKRVTIKFEAL